MAQQKYTDGSGIAEIWANIKNYVTAQLLGKSDTGHTHTKSEITDFPTIPTKTSDLTNDSGYITSSDSCNYAANVTGTVAIGHGGTGATTRLRAVQNLTNENVGTSTDFFLTITANWGKAGYCSVNNAKSVLGVPTNTNQLTNGAGFITADYAVPRSGGAVMTGDLLASPTTNSMGFGYGWGNGGTIYTYSPTHSTTEWQGTIRLEPLKTTNYFKTMQLAPGGTWTWTGTACQLTSDQRLKQQIAEIDDKLLDAWEDVELVQFKYNESVDTKGKSARLHTGYVVQQIDSACKSHGVDVSRYGLYCHEEYPQETKEVEVEQADGTKVKEKKVIHEASEHYSLRYTEVYAVECMYLRRCIARLTARIEELEKGNSK